MKMKRILAILGFCLVGPGCGPIAYATRTIIIEPIQYCLTADNILETRRNYQLAEEAWERFTKEEPDHKYSSDYATGFKDGFADYLYAGGTGEPPPLPPRYYWKIHYETPEGHQAMIDWFAGYRHGAAVAQESGYRQWVTIPSSLPPRPAPDGQPLSIAPESAPVPASEPVLPPPRKVAPPPAPEKTGTANPGSEAPETGTAQGGSPSTVSKEPPANNRADPPVRVVLPPN